MEIRMRIQMSKLNTVLLPVPSSSEQHHIADYLDRKCSQIDSIISRVQGEIEKLKEYKLSVITEAVQTAPSWVRGHLGYLVSFKNGLNYDGKYEDSEIKFL